MRGSIMRAARVPAHLLSVPDHGRRGADVTRAEVQGVLDGRGVAVGTQRAPPVHRVVMRSYGRLARRLGPGYRLGLRQCVLDRRLRKQLVRRAYGHGDVGLEGGIVGGPPARLLLVQDCPVHGPQHAH